MTPSTAVGLGGFVSLIAIAMFLYVHSQQRVVEVGFWFEGVTFDLPRLRAEGYGGNPDSAEQQVIVNVARAEIERAFAGLRVVVSDNRRASYKIQVIQEFPPSPRAGFGVAGQSRGIAGLGGTGSVGFTVVGSLAVRHAPKGTTRAAVITAIGRGLGRSAVHELAHQLLPTTGIHDSRDEASFEYDNADRAVQYYGDMRWSLVWPLLESRLGRRDDSR
jgi:hypothetical protein